MLDVRMHGRRLSRRLLRALSALAGGELTAPCVAQPGPLPRRSASGVRDASLAGMTAEPAFPAQRIPTIRRVMSPQDSNVMGTVFGGAILSDIDLAAAIEAHKLHPDNVVTVAMDKVEFKRPIYVGDLVSLFTETVRVGRTSITVRVTVWAQRRLPPRDTVPVTEALVTMVAVDEGFRPVPVTGTTRT